MKRALVITSAGTSTRFSQSIGHDVLKVLYSEQSPEQCILAWQLELFSKYRFDKIIIVGGYRFDELKEFVSKYFCEENIELVFNQNFKTYGTCYSFVCGLEALSSQEFDQILFVEGDLFFDTPTFSKIVEYDGDVVTANSQLILAKSAVVFYVSDEGRLKYIYDQNHKCLKIDSGFSVLGNSGQVWKFCDIKHLYRQIDSLGVGLHNDTNLLIISKYFDQKRVELIEFVTFIDWFNCNTVSDYHNIFNYRGMSC